MKSFEYDECDQLAVAYLGGSEEFKQQMTNEIARLPHARRARVVLWAILGVLIVLAVAFSVACYVHDQTYDLHLNWRVLFLINGLYGSNVLVVVALYMRLKPSIYDLLYRFLLRHPDSVHVRLIRNANGSIDWSKADAFRRK